MDRQSTDRTAPGRHPSRSGRGPRDRKTEPNVFAVAALVCGAASFVPWVVLAAYPLTLAFGLLGLTWGARKRRGGRGMAAGGILLGTLGVVIQLALALLASVVGWLVG